MTGPVPPPPSAMPPNLVRPPSPPRVRRRRPLLVVLAVVVVAAVVVVVVTVVLKSSGLPIGRGTATITWKLPGGRVNPPAKAFSGRADGLTLTGTVRGASPSDVGSSPSGSTGTLPELQGLHLARWTGTLGGTAFNLDVTESVGTGQEPPVHNKFVGGFSVAFLVTGTFGSRSVHVTATPEANNLSVVKFSGTVGNFTVTGTTTEPQENGKTGTVHATYTVKAK